MSTLRFSAPAAATRRIGSRLAATAPIDRAHALPRARVPALPSVVATSLLLITPDNVADVAARLSRRGR